MSDTNDRIRGRRGHASAPPLLLTDEGRRVIAQAMERHADAAMDDYHDCDDAARSGPLLAAAHLAREHAIAFLDAGAT